MIMRKIVFMILPVFALICLHSCELEQFPDDALAAEEVVTSPEYMLQATMGQLHNIKGHVSVRGEKNWKTRMPRVVDMMCHMASDMHATNSYGDLTNYGHYTTTARLDDWSMNQCAWTIYYRNIVVCNSIIDVAAPANEEEEHMLGMNYFLRALWYSNLMRVWARPYTHGRDKMGVPLRIDSSTDPLPRATVGEVYDQIVKDLLMAESLLKDAEPNRSLPNKQAAQGMLARIYCWMADPAGGDSFADEALKWANACIGSSVTDLAETDDYFGSMVKRDTSIAIGTPINHYWSDVQNSEETLFCVGTVATDDVIPERGRMWMRNAEGIGWGQHAVSDYYIDVLDNDPGDLRANFVETHYIRYPDGTLVKDPNGDPLILKDNGWNMFNTNKFSYAHGGDDFMSDILWLRLADVYLYRAEAYAKKGMTAEALADVNVIRGRAMATTFNSLADYEAMYPTNPGNPVDHVRGETPNAATALDVVLNERFLELAWEFYGSHDFFRNKRGLFRNFPGTLEPKMVIPWNTDQITPPLPRAELEVNPLIIQNPIPPDLVVPPN